MLSYWFNLFCMEHLELISYSRWSFMSRTEITFGPFVETVDVPFFAMLCCHIFCPLNIYIKVALGSRWHQRDVFFICLPGSSQILIFGRLLIKLRLFETRVSLNCNRKITSEKKQTANFLCENQHFLLVNCKISFKETFNYLFFRVLARLSHTKHRSWNAS